MVCSYLECGICVIDLGGQMAIFLLDRFNRPQRSNSEDSIDLMQSTSEVK